jgi:amino acid transporter
VSKLLVPPRTVGIWGAALLPVNGMIGAGIFAMPAVLVAAIGGFAPWQMLLSGIVFLPLVLTFAWLSTHFDGSGGPVLYGKTAFGPFLGFQAGWARYAAGTVAVAANTHVMVSYFAALLPALNDPVLYHVTVVLVIALLTGVTLVGMRQSVAVLGLLTLLKLLPIGLLVASALLGPYAGAPFLLPEFGQVESVLLLSFYAFIGFEGGTMPAGELRDPKRDIPRALVATLLLVTLIYMLVIWAFGAIAPEVAESRNALAEAAQISLGQLGSLAIVLAAGFSIAANSLSGMVAIPRMAFGMAREGMLPAWFGRISPRWLTPANAILCYGGAAVLFSLWGGFTALAAASTLTRLLTYLISAAALPVIERRLGVASRLHEVIAVFAIAITFWIASHAATRAWVIFAAITGVGTLLYLLERRVLSDNRGAA